MIICAWEDGGHTSLVGNDRKLAVASFDDPPIVYTLPGRFPIVAMTKVGVQRIHVLTSEGSVYLVTRPRHRTRTHLEIVRVVERVLT